MLGMEINMKRFAGFAILFAVFAVLFVGVALSKGWLIAAMVWGISAALTCLIVLAVHWIVV
jgi:hypothetical protein